MSGNPKITAMCQVKCPQELWQATGLRRLDEAAINPTYSCAGQKIMTGGTLPLHLPYLPSLYFTSPNFILLRNSDEDDGLCQAGLCLGGQCAWTDIPRILPGGAMSSRRIHSGQCPCLGQDLISIRFPHHRPLRPHSWSFISYPLYVKITCHTVSF